MNRNFSSAIGGRFMLSILGLPSFYDCLISERKGGKGARGLMVLARFRDFEEM